ncbi:hypothetical protein AC249_AIPGENE2235 [Exaiptasia diaphana]|nr:hypothetical protein AC249_AIPGENE2235 [Exaiptasia diaphana]
MASAPEEVLELLRNYLEEKIEGKDKRAERKTKAIKQVAKFKGKENQKQFELNAEIEDLFLRVADADEKDTVETLAREGLQKVKRRQKIIKDS